MTAVNSSWSTVDLRKTQKRIIAASDSSKFRWGTCYWSEDRVLISCKSGRWEENLLDKTIFVKELRAAVMLIEQITSVHHGVHIELLVDNTAAASVLTRMASSTLVGCELARRADDALRANSCTLTIIRVASAQNPADEPSRNKILDPKRVQMMWLLVASFRRGNLTEPTTVRCAPTKNSVRHPETDTSFSHKDIVHVENPGDDAEDDAPSDFDEHEEFANLCVVEDEES